MNFTSPVNATASKPSKPPSSTRSSFVVFRWIKVFLKGLIYLLVFVCLIGGGLLFFAPSILSQSWAQPLLLKTLFPSLGTSVVVSMDAPNLSWWDDQVFHNIRFSQTTPSEEREILIKKVVVKGGLLALAPWQTHHSLQVEASSMEVVRTPRDEYYTYRMENENSPLPENLSLNAEVETLRFYPFGRDGMMFDFETATLAFTTPSQPLSFKGEGRMISSIGEPLGAFESNIMLYSANDFCTFSFRESTTLPVQTALFTFEGPLGEGEIEVVGQADRRMPQFSAKGSLDLSWWLAKMMDAPWMSSSLTALTGRCQWSIKDIVVDEDEVSFQTAFMLGSEANPIHVVYDSEKYAFCGEGATKVSLSRYSPYAMTLSNFSLDLPIGHVTADATLSQWRLMTRGELTADLKRLWSMPSMAGLRSEGVWMTGQGSYPFTYEGPLTCDREKVFQSATASMVLVCETLTLPEKTLPKITFNLALKDAMLHCKGDFMVRKQPFQVILPMAEVFGTKCLDANTLRSYCPQIKGSP